MMMRGLTRRGFLESSLSVLVVRALANLDAPSGAEPSGTVPFVDEPDVPMDTLYGDGLDGRLNTDLSKVSEQSPVVESARFFVRTRFPERLALPPAWRIRVSGAVKRPPEWSVEALDREAEDCGIHVMDCAGNTRARRFGLIGEARWRGVPFARLLPQLEPSRKGARIRISGLDRRAPAGASARDGSWVFDFEDLVSTRAFLATGLDGKPLSKDHGAPVRLVVPGWYGCASVKWVDGLVLVDRQVEATAQMKEYASRTNQDGLPVLARDYRPPRVEPAALPIRVEKWKRSERVFYRIVGIAWGDIGPTDGLSIRLGPDSEARSVAVTPPGTGWTIWTHEWTPARAGTYPILLSLTDRERARRLTSGLYTRTVHITQI